MVTRIYTAKAGSALPVTIDEIYQERTQNGMPKAKAADEIFDLYLGRHFVLEKPWRLRSIHLDDEDGLVVERMDGRRLDPTKVLTNEGTASDSPIALPEIRARKAEYVVKKRQRELQESLDAWASRSAEKQSKASRSLTLAILDRALAAGAYAQGKALPAEARARIGEDAAIVDDYRAAGSIDVLSPEVVEACRRLENAGDSARQKTNQHRTKRATAAKKKSSQPSRKARQKELQALKDSSKRWTDAKLAAKFGVSVSTVRRDLGKQ